MVEQNKNEIQIKEEEQRTEIPAIDSKKIFTLNKFADNISKNEKIQLYTKNFIKWVDSSIDFMVHKEGKSDRNEVVQTARGPIVFGMWTIIFTVGFCGIWSATAPLDSASHAMGTVVFE